MRSTDPIIRIASVQEAPERVVIDTNLPTIVPAIPAPTPILVEGARPSELAMLQTLTGVDFVLAGDLVEATSDTGYQYSNRS
jgi:hypothetical protein